jgi:hypothetical protein
MANYIKIKAADINIANQTSDVIISNVESCYAGLANGSADLNKFTIIGISGEKYTFTVDFQGPAWANQVISALTANPGGPLAIVQNSTGTKITDIVVS